VSGQGILNTISRVIPPKQPAWIYLNIDRFQTSPIKNPAIKKNTIMK